MYDRLYAGCAAATLMLVAQPGVAWAQRAGENALASSDDAFGTNIGNETTGIYTENDTRGFSPHKAGNVRVDGIYFDPTGPAFSGRLRASTAIRIGFAAETFPFPAPTGIVDHRLRPFPDTFGMSFGFTLTGYSGAIGEWDLRLPIVKDHLALTGGFAFANMRSADGQKGNSWGATARPIFKSGGIEFTPFAAIGKFDNQRPHPLAVVTGPFLPKIPPRRRYFGQDWAKGQNSNEMWGAVLKAAATDRLSLRAGVFRAVGDRQANFSEIFTVVNASGMSNHLLISDPRQDVHSTSGEAQVALRLGGERWQHRLIAGFRARNRYTESGGSSFHNFGQVVFGELDPEEKPTFVFSAVNEGRVRQSSWMLGYLGSLDGFGRLNLGIQKARYRADLRDGRTGQTTGSRDNPWLYNAMIVIDLTKKLSFYAATERGLEDSGIAPESASNRNEQLPATRTTQYEGGVRWRFNGGQFVVNAFQITKPYFSFNAAGRFEQLGQVRHRGLETSLSGRFGTRLTLVGGLVAMKPRVSGETRDLGLVGKRPAGTPPIYAKIDVNYRTDLLGGLTPLATLTYTGSRAVSARAFDVLDGKQLMLDGYASLDIGLRQQFRLGQVPASFRIVLYNVFNRKTWKILAANTLQVEEQRRVSITLAADF